MIWYELTPFDTLFFRGAIPLEAGLPVSDNLFPPPASVIKGAIWTAGKQDFSVDPSVKVSAILLKKAIAKAIDITRKRHIHGLLRI
ncbi:MAG: hypothetical protein LBN32_02415 [Helicobacteraceae bacterium]|jgi:hypothetical protein|nr:hypothetical protein [Helicobacteraceae bacterium]